MSRHLPATTSWLLFSACVVLLAVDEATSQSNSTEGTFYLIAFPPTKLDVDTGRCQVVVDSKYTVATVTISLSTTNSETRIVSPYQPWRYSVSCSRRTTAGIEDKAYFVESDYPVSVTLLNEADGAFSDATVAQPVDAGSTDFYLINEATTAPGDCGVETERTFSYFVVMAQEEETLVVVTDSAGVPGSPIFLQPHQTYTVKQVYALRSTTFTGYKVSSQKPLAVVVGNACYCNGDATVASPTFSFVPPFSRVGLEYVIPRMPLDGSPAQEYTVTVVATDDLLVTISGDTQQVFLGLGQARTRGYAAGSPSVVACTQKCVVAVTTENNGPSFTSFIPPRALYNKEVYFTEPELASREALKISVQIVTFSDEFDQFYFDGQSLANIGWSCAADILFFCFANFDLPSTNQKAHNISSGPDDSFTALVYAQKADNTANFSGRGYGHHLGYNAAPADPIPPPVVVVPSPPFYEFFHEANFTSSDVMVQSCQLSYGTSLKSRASEMIPTVNSLIGSNLCSSLTSDDVRISSVSSLFGVDGTGLAGGVNLKWTTSVPSGEAVSFGLVEACSVELSDYLADFVNWGPDPILPPVDGCPEVTFRDNSFTQLGQAWSCPGSFVNAGGRSPFTDSVKITLELNGYFETVDGAILSGSCSNQHSGSFDASTSDLVVRLNDNIRSGALCPDVNGNDFLVLETNYIWSHFGDKGTTEHVLTIDPDAETTFAIIQSCVSEISDFVENQANWNQPILPDVEGCPSTTFTQFSFQERLRTYECS